MIEQTGGCKGSPRLTGYSIKDINTHCMQEFQAHVDCLENNNQTFFNCRRPEQKLNGCIFDKLVRSDYPHGPFPSLNALQIHQQLITSRV